MPSTSPSHPHDVITSVIDSLSTIAIPPPSLGTKYEDPTSSSALSRLSGESEKRARAVMMTLHFLFPHELLPALDLLDRELVTRFEGALEPEAEGNGEGRRAASTLISTGDALPSSSAMKVVVYDVFYVQSASAVTANNASSSRLTGRFRRAFNPSCMYYEVRLDAWNCSCPAFAYSAFGEIRSEGANQEHETSGVDEEETEAPASTWRFGGSVTGEEPSAPVCKHILAVALGTAAPNLFSEGIKTRRVTAVELAGWAGGWGE